MSSSLHTIITALPIAVVPNLFSCVDQQFKKKKKALRPFNQIYLHVKNINTNRHLFIFILVIE